MRSGEARGSAGIQVNPDRLFSTGALEPHVYLLTQTQTKPGS